MEPLLQDVRYALRMLRTSPSFTLTAAAAIMLGTAAVTTIFTVVNTLLIAPAPALGDPGALVDVTMRGDHGRRPSVVSYPFYRDLAHGTRTLSGLAASAEANATVTLPNARASDSHESHGAMIVSGNYFDVLRVRPAAGRFFRASEDSVPLAAPVAVVSSTFAANRLGGPTAAVGRQLAINGTTFTIVGVAPPDFGGTIALIRPDIFVPGMMASVLRKGMGDLATSRNAGWVSLVGRLAPNATRGAAQAELTTLATRINEQYKTGDPSDVVAVSRLLPIPAQGRVVIELFMGILMTVAGLVLLIASVNVGNMLLARGLARRKEFVVRLALGATRRRLIRQLLTESVTLFVIGGTAGVLLTAWIVRFAERVHIDVDVPLTFRFPVDTHVLAFTLLVTFATGVVFGLVPALAASRRDLASALRSDSAGVGDRRERSRNVFVTAQLAMSVLLLVSAGLFLRALERASRIDPGYDYEHIAAVPLDLLNSGYDSVTKAPFLRELAARVSAMPGVDGVTYSALVPLNNNVMATVLTVPGRHVPGKGEAPDIAAFEIVGRDFLRVVHLPLLAGRAFDASDVRGAPMSIIVNAEFVRHFLPTRTASQAVGRTITIDKTSHTIVGVMADARFASLADPVEPFMLFSDAQRSERGATLLVHTTGDPAALGAQIQRLVLAIDPTLPTPKYEPLVATAATGLLPQRAAALVTASLGALGLLLAAIGVYGVVTYGVGQRVREIGVRMALGASERDVVRMIVRDGWRLAAIGLAVGLAVATVASRVLSRFLLGVSPLDPLTLGAVPLVLLAVTLLASWLPARRAARIDVSRALREG
ncbi:MAG TPA: ABC transporter permease [Gemmatimonadaceae bacterium]|nr:ABC transporter permease [Gemmatimonadaceae bacterium]